MINGVSIPHEDNRGRAFSYKDSGPHYVGPCLVNGILMKIKIWENQAENGRKYLRMVFDNPSEQELLNISNKESHGTL